MINDKYEPTLSVDFFDYDPLPITGKYYKEVPIAEVRKPELSDYDMLGYPSRSRVARKRWLVFLVSGFRYVVRYCVLRDSHYRAR